MKTEEINPGDILYEKERKLLVKVARVDEDGVVKCSAYTDMQNIFKTVPPPYRIGIHTAEAYVFATDEQRKYMERKLAVCEYVNLPKNNRMETLAYIIADLKAENVELEQRVHQLIDDYNDVESQLRGKEKHEPNIEGYTLGELTEALDKCEALKKDNKMLKQQCVQLQTERNEAQPRADYYKRQKNELFRQIQRFEQSDFMEIGVVCSYKSFAPEDSPVKVGSTKCVFCRHFLKMDKSFCVLCACRYDYMNAGETKGYKDATD